MLNPRERQRLQMLFERGRRIVQSIGDESAGPDPKARQAAHELFAECVSSDPANLLYAEAMLQNLSSLHPERRSGLVARLLNFAKGAVRTELQKENWLEAV